MYVLIVIAVTVLVITMAWRGIGATQSDDESQPNRQHVAKPVRPRQVHTVAPDDDPEFLREIDRKLRGEDKSG